MRASDFNYKVALASGLKSLQAGQPHKADEQFRYLRERFPLAEGGYRGLAKVRIEAGDTVGALVQLRDGAAALAKAGERSAAIGLLREILALDPVDVVAHRRLAAALILTGDRPAALVEYERFIEVTLQLAGGGERAKLEVAYAREQLGDSSALAGASALIVVAEPDPANRITLEPAPPLLADQMPVRDAGALEAQAASALVARDPSRACAAVLAAARLHVAGGRLDAASDLLLATVGAGLADREVQRLLIEVTGALGAKDTARDAAALLARLHALDGHPATESDRSIQAR